MVGQGGYGIGNDSGASVRSSFSVRFAEEIRASVAHFIATAKAEIIEFEELRNTAHVVLCGRDPSVRQLVIVCGIAKHFRLVDAAFVEANSFVRTSCRRIMIVILYGVRKTLQGFYI